ncbi:lantibiotic dehydratase family protein [Nocardiopsis sp. CT-R113]|uniref:Lantibiotic dehydratase family protein n=1 Tax=Nocardiopsis codii TaxID=3065942 RepID=A0ABU7K9N9_9ACTN|nr:lantibiotic dehydratase family protein [Nocardiopsis sp. CT-R113]MEE2038956.1 lantibiotic dehydratase family protein [Nocardiopsis sp. CT-R113]
MGSGKEQHGCWRVVGRPLVRASLLSGLPTSGVPDLSGSDPRPWLEWLRRVREHPGLTEAIRHTSPDLAAGVDALLDQDPAAVRVRRARKATASVLRYVLRADSRATPFGLFAGVTAATFSEHTRVVWGGAHRKVVSPGGAWVAEVVSALEALPVVRERLLVVVNNTAVEECGHLVVPQYTRPGQGAPGSDTKQVEIRINSAIRLVLETARQPAPWSTLRAKLAAEYPAESAVSTDAMLARLVQVRALLTSLAPASTETDSLGCLVSSLAQINGCALPEVRPLVSLLQEAHTAVEEHNRDGGPYARREADEAVARVSWVQPLGVDVRVDADLALPMAVARAAEQAAHMLAVLSPHPGGLPAWHTYRERFADRYGDAFVPVREVVHPQTGLGFPAGYATADAEGRAELLTSRVRWLLEQAQAAALDGRREISADALLDELAGRQSALPPGHTELNLRVESPSRAALDSGRFRVAVLGASRSAATMAGRFAALAGVRDDLREAVSRTTSAGAVPVQLSFPPLRARSSHLVRSERLLDHLISVGEYPASVPGQLGVDDLAIGCDDGGLFLFSRILARRVEPVVPHALNLRYAPLLARFLAELPRAGRAVVIGFDWGAASSLPFLPRVRSGNVVLANARWRVRAADLPPHTASWPRWRREWALWAERRNLPGVVDLGKGDQRLRLDLAEPAHLFLLRAQVDKEGGTVLTEAPDPRSSGWCEGRPIEVLVQLCREEVVA